MSRIRITIFEDDGTEREPTAAELAAFRTRPACRCGEAEADKRAAAEQLRVLPEHP